MSGGVIEADAHARAAEDVLAQQLYEEGLAALEDEDAVEASSLFSQALESYACRFGDTSVEAAIVCVKYGTALLACSRLKGTSLLGNLKTNPDGASTSAQAAQSGQDEDASGEEDLQLAWEVSEMARVVLDGAGVAHEKVSYKLLTEVHELLGDIGSERESFEDSVVDIEKALALVEKVDGAGLRWHANLHFKSSLALEFLGRIEDAMDHTKTALQQIKYLIKQKEAEKQELEKLQAERPAVTAADTAATCQAPVAAAGTSVEGSAEGVPVTGRSDLEVGVSNVVEGKAHGDGAVEQAPEEREESDREESEEDEVEEDEYDSLVEEIKGLKTVAADLADRQAELISAKDQNALVKSKLKQFVGTVACEAGPSSSKPADDVKEIDLGVVSGRKAQGAGEVAVGPSKPHNLSSGKRSNTDMDSIAEDVKKVKQQRLD